MSRRSKFVSVQKPISDRERPSCPCSELLYSNRLEPISEPTFAACVRSALIPRSFRGSINSRSTNQSLKLTAQRETAGSRVDRLTGSDRRVKLPAAQLELGLYISVRIFYHLDVTLRFFYVTISDVLDSQFGVPP